MFSRQTILHLLNYRVLLILINSLRCSASLERLHTAKRERNQASFSCHPHSVCYSCNSFVLLKLWRGECLFLPNKLSFPLKEADPQTNQSATALEESAISLPVSALLRALCQGHKVRVKLFCRSCLPQAVLKHKTMIQTNAAVCTTAPLRLEGVHYTFSAKPPVPIQHSSLCHWRVRIYCRRRDRSSFCLWLPCRRR